MPPLGIGIHGVEHKDPCPGGGGGIFECRTLKIRRARGQLLIFIEWPGGPIEKKMLEQRLGESEGGSPLGIQGKTIPGRQQQVKRPWGRVMGCVVEN